jgi:putative addiction module killer protein
MYQVEEYFTGAGACPFEEWLEGLRDIQAKKKILGRIARVRLGNLGDWKRLENAQGIFELREHFGAGYRIYFGFVGKTVILLLAGSSKSDQDRMIRMAERYWDDYQRRAK